MSLPNPYRHVDVKQETRVYVCLFCRKQRVTLRRLRPHNWYARENCIKARGGSAEALRAIYVQLSMKRAS